MGATVCEIPEVNIVRPKILECFEGGGDLGKVSRGCWKRRTFEN
jgi:hypothetical protein